MSDALFRLVSEYHSLGHHRTGSTVDHSTAAWFAEQLTDRGLSVRSERVPYDAFTSDSTLTLDGEEIDHLVVPYEWTGSLTSAVVDYRSFDPRSGGVGDVLDAELANQKAGVPLVLSTEHPNGALVGVNRSIRDGSGVPTVLIAGRHHGRATTADRRLDLHARRDPGFTHNVIATNQHYAEGEPSLLLTTPLTGWFGCAGERGTGIAVLLALVEQLSHLPLYVVATGGHELDFFGADRWLETSAAAPRCVVHVGASVAVLEGNPDEAGTDRPLASTRMAFTNQSVCSSSDIASALEPANLAVIADTDRWLGEGTVFSKLDVPILSMVGAGIDFHTPEDTPERVTSPEALSVVANAVAQASEHLYHSSSS